MGIERRKQTYYEILGIPIRASLDHVKDSYLLLTKRTALTDVAYATLTNPDKRLEYDAWIHHGSSSEPQLEVATSGKSQDWGKRGRERCSCGKVLKPDDEWHCQG